MIKKLENSLSKRLSIFLHFEHQNIIKFIGDSSKEEELSFMIEWMENGSLEDVL